MQVVVRPCPKCGALISAPDVEDEAGVYMPLRALIEHDEEFHPVGPSRGSRVKGRRSRRDAQRP